MTAIVAALTPLYRYVLLHATRRNGLKLLSALVAFYLFKYRSHAVGTRRRRDLKQPKGAVPLLGHMPLMASVGGQELYQFLEKQYNELGPIWAVSLPLLGNMIQIDTPEHVEHILKTNFWSYGKGTLLPWMMGDLFGKGIFASDGDEWKFQRKLASHIFNVKAFREYTSDVFVTEGQKVVDYLGKAADEGTIVDFHALMLHFTLDSFGTISFGKSFGCLDNIEHEVPFAVSFDDLTEICSERLKDPAWQIRELLTGVNKQAKYHKNLIRGHGLELIKKRRREGYSAHKKDLLQLFMEVRDDDGQPLSDEFLVDIIMNFTIAGRDTTAQALSWMFYLVYRDGADKEIAEKLTKEVDTVLQGGNPTYESHKQQKYAEACFHEALRIYPSVPRNLKVCLKDDVLPDGTKVHAGEWVTWSSYVMGRSERIWGPDAKEYRPSRWINTEKPSQGKFNSFHAGPRVCLGQQFATIEALSMIGMILQKFEVSLVEPSKEPQYGVSVTFPMLDGLKIRVKRRSN
ncbi:Protein kinase alk2 [Mortierella sp. NVP85]|nr:Protein kinase alk2 [Mortierella sp. NVP85]